VCVCVCVCVYVYVCVRVCVFACPGMLWFVCSTFTPYQIHYVTVMHTQLHNVPFSIF